MAYNYLQDMPKQGSMDSLIQGYDIGQKYRQNQILQNDNKALADILRGDVGALSRLQSPELIQKAQNHLRELEQRKALQGFYTPATKDQYQANVTQNPIAAIMDGGKKPSNLVQAQQPSYQESQAPTMLDMLQTGKIASGKPASYDVEGAGNYLLGQGNFDQLGKLTDYRKAIAKDEAEWGTNPTKGINPSTGLADSYITDRKGNIKWLGSGVYEAPKEARPVPVMRNGRPVTVQVPGTNEVKILMSDGTYMSGGSIPAPKTEQQPAGDLVQTVNGWEFVPKGNVPKGAPLPTAASRPTEDENKATQWAVQAQYATDNMSRIFGLNPDAAKQGMIESILPESIANYMRSADRQQFQQSAGSFAEAALRAATGAGVQEAEARQKIAELTPVWGDKAPVIAQKLNSIPLYLASLKVRAGRGLAPVNEAIAKAGNPFDTTIPVATQTPTKNANGWTLHTDKNGNKAYVSPDGKQFQEVK